MNQTEQLFTISIFTENRIGILNRITIIFTRRHLNIESITASQSEIPNVFRYTILTKTTVQQVNKVVAQIEKLVEVLKAFVHTEAEVVYQEIGLYKIYSKELSDGNVEKIIRENHARILAIEKDFVVVEKTGHTHELQKLFDQLEPFGILEYVASGRVAITKPMRHLTTFLHQIEQVHE